MNLCNEKHPDHYSIDSRGRPVGWGGLIEDMSAGPVPAPYFMDVKISRISRDHWRFEIDGKWFGPFPYSCCQTHQRLVETLTIARHKEAIQTHVFPGAIGRDGRWDSRSRAFQLARKLAGIKVPGDVRLNCRPRVKLDPPTKS